MCRYHRDGRDGRDGGDRERERGERYNRDRDSELSHRDRDRDGYRSALYQERVSEREKGGRRQREREIS